MEMNQKDFEGSRFHFDDPNQKSKVLLYSHDTFGLGHLRRNLAIAEKLLDSSNEFSVHLLTGSPVIQQWTVHRKLRVQPMPPVVKTGAERYEAHAKGQCFGLVKGYREALILKYVLHVRPDVFLVDHAPAGMNGELLATLALIRREMPKTRVMLGLRDILDSPAVVRDLWDKQDVHSILEHAYDDILVYGSKSLFDVVESYAISPRVAERVRYCGHVVAAPDANPTTAADAANLSPCWDSALAAGRKVVLVTAGGGGDGYALMDAYLKALAQMPADRLYSVVVTGPLMSHAESSALREIAAGRADVELVEYTTNLVPSLRAADLVVAMAGYNTSAEIIAERKRAILVPRAAPRAEQRLRASLLARLGVVQTIEPEADLTAALTELVPAAIAAPALPDTVWASLDLNGAERVTDYLLSLRAAASVDASVEPIQYVA